MFAVLPAGADAQPNALVHEVDPNVPKASRVGADGFKSLRTGMVPWGEEEVERLAQDFYELFPTAARLKVLADSYPGCSAIIDLAELLKSCRARDIERNFVFVEAVVKRYPTSVPSAFLIADAFLKLSIKLNNKLLQPGKVSVAQRAVLEGTKMKKLVSGLRYLWRSNPESGSASQRIIQLKSYLRAKRHRQEPEDHPPIAAGQPEEVDGAGVPEDPLAACRALLGLAPVGVHDETPSRPLSLDTLAMEDSPEKVVGPQRRPLKGKQNGTEKKGSGKGKKKASFHTGSKKKPDKEQRKICNEDMMVSHEGLGLPEDAHPQGPRGGLKSYSVTSETGACVDVLLVKRAFWVKRVADGLDVGARHFAWGAYDTVEQAWGAAKEACGY